MVRDLSAITTASTSPWISRSGTPIVCTTRMPERTRLLARSVAPVKSSAMQPRRRGLIARPRLHSCRARNVLATRLCATARAQRPQSGHFGRALHDERCKLADPFLGHAHAWPRDADRTDRRLAGAAANGRRDCSDAGFGLVDGNAIAAARSGLHLPHQRVDAANHVRTVAVCIFEA